MKDARLPRNNYYREWWKKAINLELFSELVGHSVQQCPGWFLWAHDDEMDVEVVVK